MCLSLYLFLYSLLYYTFRLSVTSLRNVSHCTCSCIHCYIISIGCLSVTSLSCFGEMCFSLYLSLYWLLHYTLRLFVTSLSWPGEMCLSLCLFLYSLLHCTLRLSVCHIAVMFRLNLLLPAPVLVFNVACFGEIWLSLYLFLYSMVHYILRLSVTSLACFGKKCVCLCICSCIHCCMLRRNVSPCTCPCIHCCIIPSSCLSVISLSWPGELCLSLSRCGEHSGRNGGR